MSWVTPVLLLSLLWPCRDADGGAKELAGPLAKNSKLTLLNLLRPLFVRRGHFSVDQGAGEDLHTGRAACCGDVVQNTCRSLRSKVYQVSPRLSSP